LGLPSLSTFIKLPRLYAILDVSQFRERPAWFAAAEDMAAGGVTFMQYRNKTGTTRQILDDARELKLRVGDSVRLIINDRADLCLAAGYDGLHVGQEDLSPEGARRVIGPDLWLGVSTHNAEQLKVAESSSASYIAIGPVFVTSSKERPDPVIGVEGVRRARQVSQKPLVAIGGITRANALEVLEAGADAVAVISDLVRDPRKSAEEFFRILG